ncbi:propionyl-CoA carboxylase [Striga asiatica]|uniref:Propionyl-CoA carboxylase n=1 Tax=Striga asiatica TaxID=4170 RepID=A0A5A7NX21_STRAF|nr:propionyl-CoA carboxylase [Striga asiatica]
MASEARTAPRQLLSDSSGFHNNCRLNLRRKAPQEKLLRPLEKLLLFFLYWVLSGHLDPSYGGPVGKVASLTAAWWAEATHMMFVMILIRSCGVFNSGHQGSSFLSAWPTVRISVHHD